MSQHHEEEPETIIAADFIFLKSIQRVRLLKNAIWFKQEFIQIQNNDKKSMQAAWAHQQALWRTRGVLTECYFLYS